MCMQHTLCTPPSALTIDQKKKLMKAGGVRSRERERATQRGRVLTSSVGLWEGPLGVRITQCPYRAGGVTNEDKDYQHHLNQESIQICFSCIGKLNLQLTCFQKLPSQLKLQHPIAGFDYSPPAYINWPLLLQLPGGLPGYYLLHPQ
jgi:hypothetical protein